MELNKHEQILNGLIDKFSDKHDNLSDILVMESIVELGVQQYRNQTYIHEFISKNICTSILMVGYEILLESNELFIIETHDGKLYLFMEWYGEMLLENGDFKTVDECLIGYLKARGFEIK